MVKGQPSQTALAAARHRALHQSADKGRILLDPFAVRIVASLAAEAGSSGTDSDAARPMRLFIALRSRFADDCIRNALLRGVRQVGILGAGLDTTAFRLSWDQTVTVFEIDHPETQAWKRHLLREADLAIPGAVRFLAVDFEACDWGAALLSSGFDASAPSIFIWLGVTPYLTHAAIQASLRFVGALRGGAEIVFDYGEPLDALSGLARAARESRMAQTAALGEPWISLFNPASMGELLRKEGFRHVEDRGGWDIALIYAPGVQRGEGGGGHIVRACTFEDMT